MDPNVATGIAFAATLAYVGGTSSMAHIRILETPRDSNSIHGSTLFLAQPPLSQRDTRNAPAACYALASWAATFQNTMDPNVATGIAFAATLLSMMASTSERFFCAMATPRALLANSAGTALLTQNLQESRCPSNRPCRCPGCLLCSRVMGRNIPEYDNPKSLVSQLRRNGAVDTLGIRLKQLHWRAAVLWDRQMRSHKLSLNL
jgi:hypothetical protein